MSAIACGWSPVAKYKLKLAQKMTTHEMFISWHPKPHLWQSLLQILRFVAREVAAVMVKGVQVAIVVGGGNYFRGANAWDGLERATADSIGSV